MRDPEDIAYISQLHDEATEAAQEIERLRAEVERLRAVLQLIVDHHEDQRINWESIDDADNRDYHEQRRNVALMALRGEGKQ